ncbi:hypothetical protein FG386_000336 [Cryptosporidium ryanae]|uniref:uncharacterized protein n=1 Tax=Cryptosporidium ryanae TaxID=515981 RepID=UPI00351A18B0|nr:hypothetical protein FG386_000336 [Cryptosporidium ryanae]
MQVIESKLLAFSRTLKNEDPTENFIFNSCKKRKNCKLVTVLQDEEKTKNVLELEFLVNASTLYLNTCPSLASRFNCKIANLIDEIKKSKAYCNFFSGKICPKCFSTYIIGKNCKLSLRGLNKVARNRAIRDLKEKSSLSEEKLVKNTFKKLYINCHVCDYTYSMFFFDKKPKPTKSKLKKDDKTYLCSNPFINYSNNLLTNTNVVLGSTNYVQNIPKEWTKIKTDMGKNNIRFFKTNNKQKAVIQEIKKNNQVSFDNRKIEKEKSTEKKQSAEGVKIETLTGNKVEFRVLGGEKEEGRSFYDILSSLA